MKINHPPTPEYLDLEDHVANQKPIPKGCRHYRLRIDRHKHKWNSDRITGRDILDLAGKVDFDKFQVNQHFRFNRVEQVQLDEIVDLAASGVERFVIVPATKAEITIIVNGRPRQVDKEELTYEEVVLLAYPNATFGASIIYTVTYQRAADECKPSGQLVPSSAAVTIKEKTKFDVSRTDKS
jgi:hypothetical protein